MIKKNSFEYFCKCEWKILNSLSTNVLAPMVHLYFVLDDTWIIQKLNYGHKKLFCTFPSAQMKKKSISSICSRGIFWTKYWNSPNKPKLNRADKAEILFVQFAAFQTMEKSKIYINKVSAGLNMHRNLDSKFDVSRLKYISGTP